MNPNNVRIAKNTLLLYFRMMLIMGVSLYTSRVVLEVLGVEDFGIYNVVGGVVAMFGFLNASMSTATSRFLTVEIGRNDFGQLSQVFGLSRIIHLILAIIIVVLAETVGLWFLLNKINIASERMDAALWVFHFSVFSAALSIIQVPYNALITAHERMNVYAYISILEVSLRLVIVFLLTWFGFDKLKLYAVLIFCVSFIINNVYLSYSRRNFAECRTPMTWNKPLFKQMFSFSGWSLFGSVAYMAKSNGVNIVLNLFFGVTVNAAWGISNTVKGAIAQFSQNFTIALNPPIMKAYAAGDNKATIQLLFRGMKFSFFLSFVLTIPFVFEAKQVLNLWLKNVPDYAVVFTQMILINSLLESFTYAIGATVQASGKIKQYQAIVGGLLLLNLPCTYLFFLFFDYPPLALIVSIVLTIISLILRFIILKKLIFFSIYTLYTEVFRFVFILSVFVFPFICILTHIISDPMFRFVIILICVCAIASIILYFFGMNQGERIFIKSKIQTTYEKIKNRK